MPTLKEAGFDVPPVPQVRGVVAPPGIPRENVAYWEGVFQQADARPSRGRSTSRTTSSRTRYQNAADLAKFYDEFTGQMRGILQEAGVKIVR